MTAVVYRMFDADGGLLYVGFSARGFTRLGEHESKEWAAEVTTITVRRYADAADALLAEMIAIDTEGPKFNKPLHAPRTRQRTPDPDGFDRTIQDAAAFLGVHVRTAQKWAADGLLGGYLTEGNRRRFRQSDLEAFVARRMISTSVGSEAAS